MADPNVPAILDAWAALCASAGTSRRSLSAADALRAGGADKLEPLLTAAGWPDACASAMHLGIALSAVARMTPAYDGRALRRAATGRWYIAREIV